MTGAVSIKGLAPARFSGVRAAFAQNFADDIELGASFAVFIDGEPVVDIHAGFSDRARETPFDETTLACVYSCGKLATAYLVARAVSAGVLDYDAPVANVWPAFAEAGKGAVTLAEVLSHQAGLCGFPEAFDPVEWLDHDRIAARIAAMAPLWPPGAANGYHPQTVGFIASELLRRTDGRSVGAILREDFPQHDIHCGLAESDIARAAFMPKPPRAPDLGTLNDLKRYAFLSPWSAPARVAREAWMAAELPASNMHATARGLAGLVHPLATGGEAAGGAALDPHVVREIFRLRIDGPDLVLPFELGWGAGPMRNAHRAFGGSPTAFGHAGNGGAAVMVDPARRVSAAYVMNRMSPFLMADPRAVRLFEALDDDLA